MSRKHSNINGWITVEDDVAGWKVKVPGPSVGDVISALSYASGLPTQTEVDKKTKRAKRAAKAAKVEVAPVVEEPKRGRGRPRKNAQAVEVAAEKPKLPKMTDVLATLQSPVTHEQISDALLGAGHLAGAIANFLRTKTFNKAGHYVEAN